MTEQALQQYLIKQYPLKMRLASGRSSLHSKAAKPSAKT